MSGSKDVSGCGGCIGILALVVITPVACTLWVIPARQKTEMPYHPNVESTPDPEAGRVVINSDFLDPSKPPRRLGPLPDNATFKPSGTKKNDRVALFRPGDSGDVLGTKNRSDFQSLRIAIESRNTEAIAFLSVQNKLTRIPNETKCVVVEADDDCRKVRIIEGPLKGKEVWVEDEFVKPRS